MATNDCAVDASQIESKIFFEVPFEQKDMAKAAGLLWDNTLRKWYAISPKVAKAFSALLENNVAPTDTTERYYFKVPFLQKEHAKAMGMRFDGIRKLWFAPSSVLALEAARFFKKLDEAPKNRSDFP